MIMALSALAAYSDSDESGPEEENTGYGTERTVSVTNPALQSKQEVRRLVSVVAGRGKTRSSVKIGLPVVDSGEVRAHTHVHPHTNMLTHYICTCKQHTHNIHAHYTHTHTHTHTHTTCTHTHGYTYTMLSEPV